MLAARCAVGVVLVMQSGCVTAALWSRVLEQPPSTPSGVSLAELAGRELLAREERPGVVTLVARSASGATQVATWDTRGDEGSLCWSAAAVSSSGLVRVAIRPPSEPGLTRTSNHVTWRGDSGARTVEIEWPASAREETHGGESVRWPPLRIAVCLLATPFTAAADALAGMGVLVVLWPAWLPWVWGS